MAKNSASGAFRFQLRKGHSMSSYYDKAIKRVLRHIDRHLDENLTLEGLAEIAKISNYHFHRIFKAYMGISLGRYIKNKRLEKGMSQLAYTKSKTINIALSSGYDSHAAFTKAFNKEIGMSPKEFRERMKDKKGNMMTYLKNEKVEFLKFVDQEDTPILYLRKTGNYHVSASEAWQTLHQILNEVKIEQTPGHYIGISHDNPHDEDIEEKDLRFDACVALNSKISFHKEELIKLGLAEGSIAGGRYAVFHHAGPFESLGESFHYIYGSWIYTQDQKLRHANPFILMPYVFDKSRKPVEQEADIYIPVK